MQFIIAHVGVAAADDVPWLRLEFRQRLDDVVGQEGREFLKQVANRKVEPADSLKNISINLIS